MEKVLFLKTVQVEQGDGRGPIFEGGKAYWMAPDSAAYWRGRDAVIDAPTDMPAENEGARPPLRADTVRIVRTSQSRYNVVGPDGETLNEAPLRAAEAERFRAAVLAGKIQPAAPAPAPTPAASDSTPDPDPDPAEETGTETIPPPQDPADPSPEEEGDDTTRAPALL